MNDAERSEQIAFLVGCMRGVIAQMSAQLVNDGNHNSTFNYSVVSIDEMIDTLFYKRVRELNNE